MRLRPFLPIWQPHSSRNGNDSCCQCLKPGDGEPVFARISSPPFHCAAMDGIAVKAETTYGASEDSPRILLIGKEAFFVNTGNPIPPEMDAVIMIEEVHLIDAQRVEIRDGAYPMAACPFHGRGYDCQGNGLTGQS